MMQIHNVNHLLSVADLPSDKKPRDLTMDEFEKICLTYKMMCDNNPKIKAYISPEIANILLENQPMMMLNSQGEESEADLLQSETPKVVFKEETDRFYI